MINIVAIHSNHKALWYELANAILHTVFTSLAVWFTENHMYCITWNPLLVCLYHTIIAGYAYMPTCQWSQNNLASENGNTIDNEYIS